jgi:hypothetical protein
MAMTKAKTVTKEKEKKVVTMPEKLESGLYSKETKFTKEQYAQLLIETGMEARSCVAQSTLFFKGAVVDTKVEFRTGEEIVKKYLSGNSKIKKEIIMQFDGMTEEDLKMQPKSVKLSNWIDTLRLAVFIDSDTANLFKSFPNAGLSLLDRASKGQKTLVAKLYNKQSDTITEAEIKATVTTMTNKLGIAAILGTEYGDITPQEAISILNNKKKEIDKEIIAKREKDYYAKLKEDAVVE